MNKLILQGPALGEYAVKIIHAICFPAGELMLSVAFKSKPINLTEIWFLNYGVTLFGAPYFYRVRAYFFRLVQIPPSRWIHFFKYLKISYFLEKNLDLTNEKALNEKYTYKH